MTVEYREDSGFVVGKLLPLVDPDIQCMIRFGLPLLPLSREKNRNLGGPEGQKA